jgi:hypothetical protein
VVIKVKIDVSGLNAPMAETYFITNEGMFLAMC